MNGDMWYGRDPMSLSTVSGTASDMPVAISPGGRRCDALSLGEAFALVDDLLRQAKLK